MKRLSLAVCGALAALLLVAYAQAADNFLGTWTLNVAKSKYDPGPPPKSQTTILDTVAGGATKEETGSTLMAHEPNGSGPQSSTAKTIQ